MKRTVLNLADWVLPRNIFRLLTHFQPSGVGFRLTHGSVLQRNKELLNRHTGQRCFILCNGPSVKRQDIKPLRNEIVISVSSGFHHPDYGAVRPRYHCVPQLTYGDMTRDKAARWFQEMHQDLHDAEVFLSSQEYELVRSHALFHGRTVRYLCLGLNHFAKHPRAIPDLAGIVPRVQTVPIMALMVALYMGFKTIFLLGTDHDWFVTKKYEYFFDRSKLGWKDPGVADDGSIETSLLDELPNVRRVWEQYFALDVLATIFGGRIYNATDGGMLDVFERVRYDDVIRQS